MLGLSFEKLILITLVAALIVGPQRLPLYAGKLARLVRAIRDLTDIAKARATTELGPDFDPSEWKKLDPRQYDPRRIIQETLADAPPSDLPPVDDERSGDVEKVDTTTTDRATPPPPIARGGWQEALLARVATATPNILSPAVATGISSSEPSQAASTYNDS